MGLLGRERSASKFERALLSNTIGAFFNGSKVPGSFGGAAVHQAFRGVGATAAFAARSVPGMLSTGAYLAASGAANGIRDYRSWRASRAAYMGRARWLADQMPGNSSPLGTIMSNSAGDDVRSRYGRSYDFDKGTYGPRKFGARSPLDHLRKGGSNVIRGTLFSPLSWGVNLGLAGLTSSDNIFDPKEGVATQLAQYVTQEIGMTIGASVGAAIGTAAMPGVSVVAGLGMLAGAGVGILAGGALIEGIKNFSDFGRRYGRHSKPFRATFMDSEKAYTMRQRAVQSIYRSQMSARSAFGSEALAYHG